jgi:hypothetical protein
MFKIKLVPYERFKEEKYDKVIKDLHEKTLIIIDAKLNAKEEAQIIAETMKGVSDRFSGIELSSLDLKGKAKWGKMDKIKNAFVERMIGKKRGITLIGPAKFVQKIKRNPEELLVYL